MSRFAYESSSALISYGPDVLEIARRAALATSRRFLMGAQPKVELVINLKTAKALGRTIPQSSSCGQIK